MRLAIHHREGSFSDRWIEYCKQQNIDYVMVDCNSSSILQNLKDKGITHLMWHFNLGSDTDLMTFSFVLNSIDTMGIKTFPDYNSRWHFDDKVAQKYFLEAYNQPLAPSHVFFDRKEAIASVKKVSFPIVAKLKRGAGASNVKLLHNVKEAEEYINIMFTEGMSSKSKVFEGMSQKLRVAKSIKNPVKLFKKVIGYFVKSSQPNFIDKEIGYFYYQDFLPNNDFDTRVIVVGDKAIGIRRYNRDNDFRASGSGKISHEAAHIDVNMVKIAFDLQKKANYSCLGFDFVYDKNKEPKIIEICFAFTASGYDACEGYWDEDLNYHPGRLNLQHEMVKHLLK